MSLLRPARSLLPAAVRCRLPAQTQIRAIHLYSGPLSGCRAAKLSACKPVATRAWPAAPARTQRHISVSAQPQGEAASDADWEEPILSAEELQAEKGRKKVAVWLFFCAGLCFLIVIVGGITRLTESGLSITEWKPFRGAVPPSSEEEWQKEFDLYVSSPEFRQRDEAAFTMADFKFIFFWEWAHRQLGRTIGLSYALPWAYFSYKGYVPKKLQPRMLGLLGLIGLQGTIGWFMVASGLDSKNFDDGSRVRVSHYRLTLHLMGAFTLYSSFLWTAMTLYRPSLTPKVLALMAEAPPLRSLAKGTTAWTLFTAASGGLVAGLDAGLVYNEWPTMAGSLIPFEELYLLSPGWRSALDHDVTVQFNHRMFAYTTVSLVLAISYYASRAQALPPQVALAVRCVQAAVALQATMGILTVLNGVPIPLASAHQGGSLVLLSSLMYLVFSLRVKTPVWLIK